MLGIPSRTRSAAPPAQRVATGLSRAARSPRSLYLDLGGPVHVADYGGPVHGGPTIVCVHGLAGSHVSWRDVAGFLVPKHRVLAIDLPGHGRTPRHGRSSAVISNRDVLSRFLRETVGEPAVLVGTSMGAALAMLQAAAEPDSVAAMALLAPPMPRRRAELPNRVLAAHIALCSWPWLGQRVLSRRGRRLEAERVVQKALDLSCAVPARIAPETRALAIELVANRAAGDDAEAAFVEAARSVGVLVAQAASYRRTIASVTCPAVVIQGRLDRLLRAGSLEQLTALQPDWPIHHLEGVGHSPHMEAPAASAEAIVGFLNGIDRWGGGADGASARRVVLGPAPD